MLWVAALGLLLTILLFSQVLPDPGGRLVGHGFAEQPMGAWANQAAQRAIWEEGRFPWWVRGVAYGTEGGVVHAMCLPTVLLTLPFYPLLNSVASYNLAMALNLLLAFLGAYLLFRHLARTRGAPPWFALPGALVYALNPYSLDSFAYGPVECTALGWIPLALLVVERVRGNGARHHLARAGALALCTAGSPYYGMFTAMAGAYLLLSQAELSWIPRLRRAAITLGLAALLMSPFAWAIHSSINHSRSLAPSRQNPPSAAFHDRLIKELHVLDLASLVSTNPRYHTKLVKKRSYLGISALVFCVLGAWWARRSRRWLWLGGGALIFSVGGGLRIGGVLVYLWGDVVPLPAYWLLAYVPPFTEVIYPMRALPLAVLAMGAMITILLSRWKESPRRFWIMAGMCLLLALDLLSVSQGSPKLPANAFSLPPSHKKFAAEAGAFGVVDLPPPVNDAELGRYFLYQLEHRKWVPYNLDKIVLTNQRTPAIQGYFSEIKLKHSPPNNPTDWSLADRLFRCPAGCLALHQLSRLSYRYLVVHHTGNESLDHKLAVCIERCIPKRVSRDHRTTVYRLPSTADNLKTQR